MLQLEIAEIFRILEQVLVETFTSEFLFKS